MKWWSDQLLEIVGMTCTQLNMYCRTATLVGSELSGKYEDEGGEVRKAARHWGALYTAPAKLAIIGGILQQ